MSSQTLYVVRHAIAQDRATWPGPDDQRPLTAEGLQQAKRLLNALGDEDIRRVVSSPAVRCRQTVEPLARHLGLKVENAPHLHEGTPADKSLRFLIDLGRPAVAGCTHGDVIGEMVALLVNRGVIASGSAKFKKASTWILSVEDGEIRRARYLPPP